MFSLFVKNKGVSACLPGDREKQVEKKVEEDSRRKDMHMVELGEQVGGRSHSLRGKVNFKFDFSHV